MADKLELYKQLLSKSESEQTCLFCCEPINIGGTKDQSFKIKFTNIEDILITYKQDNIIISKSFKDVTKTIEGDYTTISYQLSEQETIKFSPKNIYVQLKAYLKDNTIFQSEIYELKALSELTNEQLTPKDDLYITALEANVIEQIITVNSIYPLISGSQNIYKCKFNFDNSWNKTDDIKVIFKDQYHAKIDSIQLENNECFIPNEVLEKPGIINISLIGTGQDCFKPTLWSNSIRVQLGGKINN